MSGNRISPCSFSMNPPAARGHVLGGHVQPPERGVQPATQPRLPGPCQPGGGGHEGPGGGEAQGDWAGRAAARTLRVEHVLDEVADAGCLVIDDEFVALRADQLHCLPRGGAAHRGHLACLVAATRQRRGGQT